MSKIDLIRDSLIEILTADSVFVDSITAAVGDKTKTHYRFSTWHARLEVIMSQKAESRTFNAALRRQLFSNHPVCAICQQAIHQLDDAHVDHIKPFSLGGETAENNAQLTHRFCNQKKSNNAA